MNKSIWTSKNIRTVFNCTFRCCKRSRNLTLTAAYIFFLPFFTKIFLLFSLCNRLPLIKKEIPVASASLPCVSSKNFLPNKPNKLTSFFPLPFFFSVSMFTSKGIFTCKNKDKKFYFFYTTPYLVYILSFLHKK